MTTGLISEGPLFLMQNIVTHISSSTFYKKTGSKIEAQPANAERRTKTEVLLSSDAGKYN